MKDQSTGPARDIDTGGILIDVFEAPAGQTGWPVSLGVPFPSGMLRDPSGVHVTGPDGAACATAARALVKWPDGSVRWGLVDFSARQKGAHRIHIRSAGSTAASALTLHEEKDRCTVDNGVVRLVLSAAGPSPIQSLSVHGRERLSGGSAVRFVVDDADTTREPRRKIQVLEHNALRARIGVEGICAEQDGRAKLAYRLTIELWTGWPCARLDFQFFNMTPGVESLSIRRIALEMQLATGGNAWRIFQQKYHGHFYTPRRVENPADVAIVADDTRGSAHVEDPAMLLDDTTYPSQLRPPLVETPPWLGVADAQGAVFLGMEDFEEMRPKRLWSEGSKLGLDIWPASAGALELPQGMSRRVSMTLGFSDTTGLDAASVENLLRAPRAAGRATVNPAWLARCGEFDQHHVLPAGSHSRFEQYLHRLVDPQMPQGMFDLGDTPDIHYQQTYIPLGEDYVRRRENAPRLPRTFLTVAHMLPEWALPQLYEPIWSNNEYDLIHALAVEWMRRDGAELFASLRRAVRHNIEVDFVHYSDYRWCHRASPAHCPGHTRNGAYPSHFWTQGLLEYYCLTGDADARDIAMALGDKIIEVFADAEHRAVLWGFNRELGWPMLALSCLADMTGEARYLELLDEMVDFLVSFDRDGATKPINLSGVDPRNSFVRQMHDSFFGYASMIEGIDLYLKLRARPEVESWFVKLLRELRSATWQAQRDGHPLEVRNMVTQALAIGYERTGESEFLSAGMAHIEQLLDNIEWIVPTPQTKPIAMRHRGLVRFLGHAHRQGLLEKLEYASRRAMEGH